MAKKKTKKTLSKERNKARKNLRYLSSMLLKCHIESCSTSAQRGLFNIPENPERRKIWIEACNLPSDVKKFAKICWKHFETSDFVNDIDMKEAQELGCSVKPRLNNWAVPSRNLKLKKCVKTLVKTENIESNQNEIQTEEDWIKTNLADENFLALCETELKYESVVERESTLGKNTAIDSNKSVIPTNPESYLKTKSNSECIAYNKYKKELPEHSEVPQTKLPKVTPKRLNDTKSSNYHPTCMPNVRTQYLYKCSRCGINFKKTSDLVKHLSKKCNPIITKTIHVGEKQYQVLKDNSTSERDEKIAVETEIPSTSKLNIKSECYTDDRKEILESFKDYVAGLCETKMEIKDESF